MNKFEYGKYRRIIISIILFLALDASVLGANFFMSFQIADDAIGVNVAGRQRMLSQRITKSLFDIQTSLGDEQELERSVGELRTASELFNSSFVAFDLGGETIAPDGQPTLLSAVSSDASVEALDSARPIWTTYQSSINELLSIDPIASPQLFSDQLASTLEFGRENNLALLALMNNLTVDLEGVATSKAELLRLIQTVGISLALLNFLIIIFHSVRQLRSSDRKIEAAQQETQEILGTVNEGLFLLDADGVIGEQHSAELEQIVDRADIGGLTLDELLRGLVSERDLITARKFIGLLFDPSKKEKRIGSLNPLRQVEVHISTQEGNYENKFLSFSFSRVVRENEILHVLVTVKDITAEVTLSQELEQVQKQNEQQFEMLTSMLGGDASMMPAYLDNSHKSLMDINTILREPAKSRLQLQEKRERFSSSCITLKENLQLSTWNNSSTKRNNLKTFSQN